MMVHQAKSEQLHTIVNRLLAQPRDELPIQYRSIAFTRHTLNVTSFGWFFEDLSRRLYGGRRLKDTTGHYPDLVDKYRKLRVEVKAFVSGHHLNLQESQMARYDRFLRRHPHWEQWYVLYRHSYRGVKKPKVTLQRILKETVKGPIYSVVMPYSIIRRLRELAVTPDHATPFQGADDRTLVKHYTGEDKNYRGVYTVCSPFTNWLVSHPRDTLDYLGLDSSLFAIDALRSPEKLVVAGHSVKPFPVTIIRPKDAEFKLTYLPSDVPF